MAVCKRKTLLLSGWIVMSMLLSGCGGKPLSEREVVRALFFDHQEGAYSVCLLLADQNAGKEGQSEYKTASAAADTPALALAAAEKSLSGSVYYGLMDLAALPADCDYPLAQNLGQLLYDKAQPMPELSVFLLPDKKELDWAEDAGMLYDGMKACERGYDLHCGLQQLFARQECAALPLYRESGGFDFVVLEKGEPPARYTGTVQSALAAALAGQGRRLRGSFAGGDARCNARLGVARSGGIVQLQLYGMELQALRDKTTQQALQEQLSRELQTAFAGLTAEKTAGDAFYFSFWQACLWGDKRPTPLRLEIRFES